MKAEEFVQALNDVNDKYIEEAANYKRSGAGITLWRAVAIAACVCLAGSLAFTMLSINSRKGNAQRSKTVSSEPYAEATEEKLFYDYDDVVEYETAPAYVTADYAAEVYEEMLADTSENGISSAAGLQAAGEGQKQGSKMIYNVYMNMQTKEFDAASAGIESAVSEYGGYFEDQNLSNNTGSYRNATYTIRIPVENLEDFLSQVGALSTVTYLSRSAQDVSEVYYDTQSRLDTARTKLARLQELLSQAEDMNDIITIESAISDTEYEIDSYSGSLRYYDSQVSYSTVTVNLKEVYEVVVEEAPLTFGEKIGYSFSQGIKGVGTFLKNVVIWLAASWIWIVILVVVVIAIILIIRKVRKR